MCDFVFGYFLGCWRARISHNLWALSFRPLSFELYLSVICDVITLFNLFAVSPFLHILVERAKMVIVVLLGPLVDVIGPFPNITYVEGWSYGCVMY